MSYGRKVMWPIWALLAAISLVAVYLVSYLAMVTPQEYDHEYRYGGQMAATVFRPLAACDRMLFPKRWVKLTPHYQFEGIQYFPPGPEFPLSNEAAVQKTFDVEPRSS